MAIEQHLITAVARLLEQWSAAGSRDGAPAWRVEVVSGSAPPAIAVEGDSVPPLTKVSDHGRLVVPLHRDLIGTLTERVAGGHGTTPPLALPVVAEPPRASRRVARVPAS